MAWLDRIDERQTRRLARDLGQHALALREAAQDHFGQFAQQGGGIADGAMHQLADYSRAEASLLARQAAQRAQDAGQQAAHQARRLTRAVRADPVPILVAAVGLVLFARLLRSRRRHFD